MYCPQCGTQNIEIAKFCRLCGVRIQFPATDDLAQKDLPNHEQSMKKVFIGGMLLFIALISSVSGRHIFGWMFFLGFFFIFKGMKQLSKAGIACNANVQIASTSPYADVRQTIPSTNYLEYKAPLNSKDMPPSATERTTRLFHEE